MCFLELLVNKTASTKVHPTLVLVYQTVMKQYFQNNKKNMAVQMVIFQNRKLK